MEPVRRDSNLSVEPAVRAAGANKTMSMKNNRAVQNWMKAKTSLNRQHVKVTRSLEEDRNKILKQRERLQNTSVSLTSTPQATWSVDESADERENTATSSSKKLLSLADVYAELLKTMQKSKEADLKSIQSEPNKTKTLRSETQSFQLKRVGRKPLSFSLQRLQRMNSTLSQGKLTVADEEHMEESSEKEPEPEPQGVFDLTEEELSLGPTLRLPPTSLPPITRSVSFEPKARNFQKGRPEVKDSLESRLDAVRYCRYLRVSSGYRKNPAPLPPQRSSARK